jgi:hypothetical protein
MMMTQSIPLDNIESPRGQSKFSNQADPHAEAAESLSQLEKDSSTIVTNGNSESAMAPQKVRTERYVKVSVRGLNFVKQKSLFLSWFLDNNGLPDCCTLLIPERHPNVILSFKGTHGWIELDTNHCKAPDYEVQFELKLHHAFLNRRRYVQNQPIVLRFFLLDKRENGTIESYGEVLLSVLLMSSKCANRTLIAHYVPDEKHAPPPTPSIKNSPIMAQPTNLSNIPQLPQHDRKQHYDMRSEDEDNSVAIGQPHQSMLHHGQMQHHQMIQSGPNSPGMNHSMPSMNQQMMNHQSMNLHQMNPLMNAPHLNPQVMSHQC